MGLSGGHFDLHCFSETFQGTPLTQLLSPGCILCRLFAFLRQIGTVADTHLHPLQTFAAPLTSCLSCHPSFSLILIHALYTMSFLFPKPLRIWHVLLMMSPWLPVTHQNLPNPRVPSTPVSGLTPLIFLTTVMQTLWQVSYPFPWCRPHLLIQMLMVLTYHL